MKDAQRFEMICSIFEQARGLEAEELDLLLTELCDGDVDIRQQVMSMLDAHHGSSPLDQPSVLPSMEELMSAAGIDNHPEIERYEIGERLGEGGMGVVYAAEMRNPRKPVAIKVIRLGMDSQRIVARFDLERQTLARMEHPNIASVLDAGVTSDGRPYFAMELVRGETIVRYARKHSLDTRARLELIIMVCNAIQHAHQKGIIHRDIKPSNIIVAESDGQRIPKVIDFGIAKATQDDLASEIAMTLHTQALGTPAYMSPEQAAPSVVDIDTRSDIYSLGVVLYELLTGSTPLSGESLPSMSYQEIIESIREQDPPRPSVRLASSTAENVEKQSVIEPAQLKGDLDWIVMKCLEKDVSRRYDTVNALRDDIHRYLKDEPVMARPASKAYLTRKFIRRNRGSVVAASLILGSLIIGVAGTAVGLVWALNEQERRKQSAESELIAQTEAKESAERALDEAKAAEDLSQFFILDVLSAADPSRSTNRDLTVREALVNASEKIDGKFDDRPDVEARIHNALGYLFGQLGDPELAQRHHMREWEIAEARDGELSIDAARTMHSVVGSLAQQGRDDEAIELIERQLRVIDHLGTPDAEMLRPRAIGNLGALLVRTGRHAEAAPVLEETLLLKREFYGDKHPTTLSTMNNLSSVLVANGEIERAIELGTQSFEGRTEILGENDPRTYVSLLNLARALAAADRAEEALAMLNDGVARAHNMLGENHPASMDIANTYSKILLLDDQYEASEQVARANMGHLLQSDPGMIQARTMSGYTNLTSALNKRMKFEEALHYSGLIIRNLEESDRSDHYLMSDHLRVHGQILTKLNRFEEAEAALLRAFDLNADQEKQKTGELSDAFIELYKEWMDDEPSESTRVKFLKWSLSDESG